jgi:hypothetical protein
VAGTVVHQALAAGWRRVHGDVQQEAFDEFARRSVMVMYLRGPWTRWSLTLNATPAAISRALEMATRWGRQPHRR